PHRVPFGALALDGSIQAIRGVLPIAAAARRQNVTGILLSPANASEAAIVSGLAVFPVASLGDAVRGLNGPAVPITPGPVPALCVGRRLPRWSHPPPGGAAGRGKDDDGPAGAGHSPAVDLR